MKLMKKSLAAILALAMCLSLLPLNVFAAGLEDAWGQPDPICGLAEHKHGPDCYGPVEGPTLICGDAHHTEECCAEDGSLICGVEQHPHNNDSSCYQLYCTIPEHNHAEMGCDASCTIEEHTHVWDACYKSEPVLICGYAEEHEHTAGCYPAVANGEAAANNALSSPTDANPADPVDIEGEDKGEEPTEEELIAKAIAEFVALVDQLPDPKNVTLDNKDKVEALFYSPASDGFDYAGGSDDPVVQAACQKYLAVATALMDLESGDEGGNDASTYGWNENENAYYVDDSTMPSEVQEKINASSRDFILYILNDSLKFTQSLTIPIGKTVKVYSYGKDRTIYREGSYPLFVVKPNGKLFMGGDYPLTLDGRGQNDSLLVVENNGELELTQNLTVCNSHTNQKGGGVYVHNNAKLTIGGNNVHFNNCTANQGGNNVYVGESAEFSNLAQIDGVDGPGAANQSNPSDPFDNKSVCVVLNLGIGVSSGSGILGEPIKVTNVANYWWVNPGGNGLAHENADGVGQVNYGNTNSGIINPMIVNDPEFRTNTFSDGQFTAQGLYDPTGGFAETYLSGIPWSDILRNNWDGANGIRAKKGLEANASVGDYAIVPYVAKYQTDDQRWHIDCAVLPVVRTQLNYKPNLPTGLSVNSDRFGCPTGKLSSDAINATVESLTFDGSNIAVDQKIETTRDGERVNLIFKSWSTAPDGKVKYTPGQGIIVPKGETTLLYAIWAEEGVTHDVSYTVEYYKTEDPTTQLGEAVTDTQTIQDGETATVTVDTTKYRPSNYELDKCVGPDSETEVAAPYTVTLVEGQLNVIKVYYKPTTKTAQYTIEFYKDGKIVDGDTVEGTATGNVGTDLTVTSDDWAKVTANKYQDEKFAFHYLVVDSTERQMTIGKAPTIKNDDTTVIKVYYVTQVTVTYDPRGGEFQNLPDGLAANDDGNVKFTCDKNSALTVVTATREGTVPVGWEITKGSLTVNGEAKEKNSTLTVGDLNNAIVTEDVTLAAVWANSITVYLIDRSGNPISQDLLKIERAKGTREDGFNSHGWDASTNSYTVDFQFEKINVVDIDVQLKETDYTLLGFYCVEYSHVNDNDPETKVSKETEADKAGWLWLDNIPGGTAVYAVLDLGYTVEYTVEGDTDPSVLKDGSTPADASVYFPGEAPNLKDKGTYFKNPDVEVKYGELTPAALPTLKAENADDYSVTGWTDESDTDRTAGTKITLTVDELAKLDKEPGDHIITLKAKVEEKQPELSAVKSVNVAEGTTVKVGDQITYTITVTNSGSRAASDVSFSDPLPTGLKYVSATGLVDPKDESGTVTGKIASVPAKVGGANGVATVTIVVEVTREVLKNEDGTYAESGTIAANTAEVNDVPTNPTPTIPVEGVPELTVTKTAQKGDETVTGSVAVGTTFDYVITVKNEGSATAGDVVITDNGVVTSPYVEIQSITLNDSPVDVKTFTGTVSAGNLAPDAEAVLKITVLAKAATAAEKPVKNIATAKIGNDGDPTTSNEVTTSIDDKSNLAVTKAAVIKAMKDGTLAEKDPQKAEVGDTVVYTITVTNNGEGASPKFTISDPVPAGLSVEKKDISIKATGVEHGDITLTDNTVSVEIISLAKNQSLKLTITTTVTNEIYDTLGTDSKVYNTAMAGTSKNEEPTPVDVAPKLTITKAASDPVDKEKFEVGDTITYTITVKNEGKATATNVSVEDALVNGLTNMELVSVKNASGEDVNYTKAEGFNGVKLTGLTLAQNEQVVLTITAKITAAALENEDDKVTNIATVDSDETTPKDSEPAETKVTGAADVKVEKTGALVKGEDKTPLAKPVEGETFEPTTVKAGDTIEFTVKVWNEGNIPADAVVVTDTLDGMTLTGDITVTGLTDDTYKVTKAENGKSFTLTLNEGKALPVKTDTSGTVTVTYKATVDSLTDKTTVGTAKNAVQVGNGDDAPKDEITVNTTEPNVTVTKTAYVEAADGTRTELTKNEETGQTNEVKIGQTIVYVIEVTNTGSADAENVQVTDQKAMESVAAGVLEITSVTLDSQDVKEAFLNGAAKGTVSVSTLAAKTGEVTLEIKATAKGVGDAKNTVVVKVPGEPDVTGDTPEIPVKAPKLAIKKTVDKAYARTGDELTYTITVTNSGEAEATNVVITDKLPDGLELVSATLNGEELESYSGTVAVGNLAAENGKAELVIKATVTAKAAAEGAEPVKIVNTAVVDSGDPVKPEEPESKITTTVADPKVDITKAVNEKEVKLGGTITYTITVTNSGEVAAKDVVVTDKLDKEYLEYVSATLDGKKLESYNGSVTITVPAKDEVKLVIEAKAIKVGTAKNIATVKDGENPEVPSYEVTTEVKGLKVTKSLNARRLVERSTIYPYGSITYTITVENTTGETAANVVLTDVLDSDVTFRNYRINGSTPTAIAPANGEYALGDIPAGGSVTVTITVSATRGAAVGDVIYNIASAVCTGMDTASYSNQVATEVVRRPSGGGDDTPTPPTPPSGGGGSTPTPPSGGNTEVIRDPDVPLAAAPGLNSTDHFAYIIGYENNTVRPTNNITRAEVATIFFRLMTDEFRSQNWSTTNSFPDVEEGKWYNNAVSTTVRAGLVKGYTDGTFQPSKNITRAEFAAIAARFLSDDAATAAPFSDTVGHWAERDIARAVQAGWLKGYTDGTFHPNANITRAEVMTAVNRMLDRTPDKDHMLPDMIVWSDNPETAWYYEAVQEATNGHDYERDEMGITEIWTALQSVRDWAALEKEWANANS